MTLPTEEVENFREAVENDEYAELYLGLGYTLITDWEGNGYFNPYIVYGDEALNPPTGGVVDELPDDAQDHLDNILKYEILEVAAVNTIYPVSAELRD